MDREEARKIIEALLFVSDKPVSIDTLKDVLKDIEPPAVREIIGELNNDYAASGRSFGIRRSPVVSRCLPILYTAAG